MRDADTPVADSPAERVRHAYARWAESKGADAEPLLALLGEHSVMRTLLAPPELHPLAQDRVGVEFARDYVESLVLNLEMVEFPTEEVVATGDTVVWIGSCRWRNPRTGEEIGSPKADIWRFGADGKAVSVMEMFDTLGFARLNKLV
jgi:ketosteroid isomerase-like protein